MDEYMVDIELPLKKKKKNRKLLLPISFKIAIIYISLAIGGIFYG